MRTIKLSVKLVILLLFACLMMHTGEVVSGTTTCPTTGAKQSAAGLQPMYQYTIFAGQSNTGLIYLGGPGVTSTTGPAIPPGSGFTFSKPNAGVTPSAIFFACDNSGDSIIWIGSR